MEQQPYIAFVDGEYPNKGVVYKRLNWRSKTPPTSEQVKDNAMELIGDSRPFLVLLCDYPENLDDRLREAGFNSKQEFIQNYSKVV